MARPELGGKFTLIGLFPNGIGTPQIPFPLPVLTFFNALRADAAGAYKFVGNLSLLATGEKLVQAQGMINTTAAGPILLPITMNNLQFKAFGSHVWSLEIEGQDEPFVFEFSIGHVPGPPIGGMPAGRFKF
jgi:hypothetical protein